MNKKSILELINQKCCCGSYEQITFEKAQTLVENNALSPGKLYKITGVHKNKVDVTIPVLYDDGTNSGVSIYLTAITPSEFSTEGWGEFYNPKYNQQTYGNEIIGASLDFAGTGYVNETDVATTGGTGTGATVNVTTMAGEVVYVEIVNPGTGYTAGDSLTIDSGDTNASFTYLIGRNMYNIWDGENPDYYTRTKYSIGSVTNWGGYAWERNAEVGADELDATDYLNLNSNWEKIPYSNTTYYDLVIDYIEYDWANDWIVRRRQAEPVIDIIFPFQFWNSPENIMGVQFHGISVAQWGNKYSKDTELGSGLVIANDAYVEFVNFKGRQLLGFNLNNYSFVRNNYRGIDTKFKGLVFNNYSYQIDSSFNTGAYQYYIQFDNASGQTSSNLSNGCYQDNIRISNKSSQQISMNIYEEIEEPPGISYQKNIVVDNNCNQSLRMYNGSYQDNVHILNGSNQDILFRLGSFQYYMTVNNGSYQNSLEFIGFNQQYGTITDLSGQSNGILTAGGQAYFNIQAALIGYGAGTYSPLNVELDQTSKVLIYKFTITFNGGVGDGQVGALILPDMLIWGGYFISEVIVESGLTAGGGAYITMGIETDDVDAALTSTTGLVTTLNATPIQLIAPAFTKSTGLRKLVATVGGNTISAGSCNFIIKFTKLG